MIPVSRPYLPSRKKLDSYIDGIYERNWVTNNGELYQALTQRLADYLGLDDEKLVLVGNGSSALHVAFKALELSDEVITTPFSFVATASTIKWDGLVPVFSDIDPNSWNIDPTRLPDNISSKTSAIVPVHVFGNPCDVTAIQDVADFHNLKVIYDASHCFDAKLAGKSVLEFGDISTISFHATKLFHTIEGGAIFAKSKAVAARIRSMINFGFDQAGRISTVGTNAKLNEFQAAMGLAVLDEMEDISEKRRLLWQNYQEMLIGSDLSLQSRNPLANNNYAYFPVLLENESKVKVVKDRLLAANIEARRYFYPSLDSVKCLGGDPVCQISNDIASRILCLPLWPGLSLQDVHRIACLVKEVISE